MNDELQQLLLRADADAPPPVLDIRYLPEQIRHTARNQRRLAACGLALLLLSVVSLSLRFHRQSEAPRPLTTINIDAEIHERTALLLTISETRREHSVDVTDTFLNQLQMQRNR